MGVGARAVVGRLSSSSTCVGITGAGESSGSGMTGDRGSCGLTGTKEKRDFADRGDAGDCGIGGSALRSVPSKSFVDRALDALETSPAA
jgi:hypothetical protein